MPEWIVTASESGLKLQQFLRKQLNQDISARQIKQSVDKGCCKINGRIERFASSLVGAGDRVVLDILEQTAGSPNRLLEASLKDPSRCLYQDDFLFIFNKPPGITSDDKRLLSLVPRTISSSQQNELVHRIDKDTSGALIFAKNRQVAEEILTHFKQRLVKKTYLTIIDGVPLNRSGLIENYLGKINSYQGQTVWGEVSKTNGLNARTVWELKKSGKDASLVVCYPETGRTHQIRVHMSGMGHPILGDTQYGKSFKCRYRPSRHMLHAAEISFLHPVYKKEITVFAPLPDDFIKALEAINCKYE